jgi:hypothetical protein
MEPSLQCQSPDGPDAFRISGELSDPVNQNNDRKLLEGSLLFVVVYMRPP